MEFQTIFFFLNMDFLGNINLTVFVIFNNLKYSPDTIFTLVQSTQLCDNAIYSQPKITVHKCELDVSTVSKRYICPLKASTRAPPPGKVRRRHHRVAIVRGRVATVTAPAGVRVPPNCLLMDFNGKKRAIPGVLGIHRNLKQI
jgi:hypothetical protein